MDYGVKLEVDDIYQFPDVLRTFAPLAVAVLPVGRNRCHTTYRFRMPILHEIIRVQMRKWKFEDGDKYV